jgi:hypothetical protein
MKESKRARSILNDTFSYTKVNGDDIGPETAYGNDYEPSISYFE